ncbi:hypothetical protein CY34DRAFT_808767 [Suillus luteus UH-Slu-Lm8-n1]|uniref:Uncharacterized protein n=1 Tax=Suillus luteus UH-Slu-Lm8-n1 TaxID=930992 RepID=A0A0D0ALQ6_9AGAM|nr:hypothetical protein CY34DRAFT_808767 [Suillus luteus UH-Slu-Lm8-n1]
MATNIMHTILVPKQCVMDLSMGTEVYGRIEFLVETPDRNRSMSDLGYAGTTVS